MDLNNDQYIALLLLLRRRYRRKMKYRKRYWVHPLNTLRNHLGEHIKIDRMYHHYPDKFFQYTRLQPYQFDIVLNLIKIDIEKADTTYRKAIPARIRLYVTLRFLATGDSMRSISTNFSIGYVTTRNIIKETTKAIWNNLAKIYVKPPSKDDWIQIIQDFEMVWNFPNCLGAIDGKHVVLEAPPKSGSLYYNYKGTFSLILMASCDANYKFTTVDIGAYGRESDGGIFKRSSLGKGLDRGTLPIPQRRIINNSDLNHPCTFVGDEAFSLSIYMMRPYPGRFLNRKKRIFNYRLSRARRVIENSFGILTSRFRVFSRPITLHPKQAEMVVKATIALHNFLKTEESEMEPNRRTYCPPGYVDQNDEENGEWRTVEEHRAFRRISSFGSNASTKVAQQMRENLAQYFLTEGQVSWQYERTNTVCTEIPLENDDNDNDNE